MDSYTREYKKEGYFARLNYDFDDKYYVTASYRRDGSSRFSKDTVGVTSGHSEHLGVSAKKISGKLDLGGQFKLRASYGETGNDAIIIQMMTHNRITILIKPCIIWVSTTVWKQVSTSRLWQTII